MNWMDLYQSLGKQPDISEVLETNQESQKYGLILKASEAQEIISARNQSVKSHGRIELGSELISKIITLFCRSPFMRREEYTMIINELIDIFYYFKNETRDLVGDDELLVVMNEFFNNSCQGSLELLRSRELVLYARELRSNLLKRDNDREVEQK
ncbi:hypothetical protein ASZ90_018499 [hydrocarbon metagenome]|uniref:Uncharacterized protein n=1 Tax=hydrocarbon metagenome TaxID=938273 RepID=A0A0W8E661_9ZZZZ